MKQLFTSAGISNPNIKKALTDLLDRPVEEASAIDIPTAICPIPEAPHLASDGIGGKLGDPFCQLGWKSMGLLELTALPTLKKERWLPMP